MLTETKHWGHQFHKHALITNHVMTNSIHIPHTAPFKGQATSDLDLQTIHNKPYFNLLYTHTGCFRLQQICNIMQFSLVGHKKEVFVSLILAFVI